MNFSLYEALIRPIRDQDRDAGGLWLQRFLERPQWWFNTIQAKIKELQNLISADKCPAELLDYLLAIVGFTSRYSSIVSRLDENTKRRLIHLAIPLWKMLFTEYGCERMVRVLTGKTPYIRNWFDFRTIIGEVILGEDQVGYDFWVIGAGALARFDQYTSQIRIMDDGLLDEILLLRLLEIMRPLNERFEVSLVDFLDVFQEGRAKWTTLSGTPASITPDLTFKIPSGTTELPSMPIAVDALFYDYVTMHKFKIINTGGFFQFYRFTFLRQDSNNFFALHVFDSVTIPVGNVILWQVTGGVPWPVAFGTFPIAFDTFYKLRVRTLPGGTGPIVKVYLDSNNVFNYVSPLLAPANGKIASEAVGTDVEIDNVELYRNPLRWATIEPAGTTTGPGWVA